MGWGFIGGWFSLETVEPEDSENASLKGCLKQTNKKLPWVLDMVKIHIEIELKAFQVKESWENLSSADLYYNKC